MTYMSPIVNVLAFTLLTVFICYNVGGRHQAPVYLNQTDEQNESDALIKRSREGNVGEVPDEEGPTTTAITPANKQMMTMIMWIGIGAGALVGVILIAVAIYLTVNDSWEDLCNGIKDKFDWD